MNEHFISAKKHLAFSVVLICLFLIASISFPVIGRWESFRALGLKLAVLVLWVIWVIHAGWILLKRAAGNNGRVYSGAKLFGAVLVSVSAIGIACLLGGVIGKTLRFQEVKAAVDAGLREDCLELLQNWPVKGDRIEGDTPQFSKLPSSIKMLAPAYLSNDHLDDTNVPPNIGLCKNGWGGFALGIRVFKNDEDVKNLKSGEYLRVSTGVYIWWQNT